jgi:hypothetical protein
MKTPAWSYSSITLFDQCPKKYYHLRVAKDLKEPESEAMLYGTAVHEAAEKYMRDDEPIPEKFAYIEPYLRKLKAIPGEKLCEHKMGLKRTAEGMQPCGFFDPDVWFRGIADLLIIDREKKEARVIDYKTGKSARYADPKQLALMASCVFFHFPEIERVRSGLLFVVSKDFIPVDFMVKHKHDIFVKLDDTLVSRETAYETQVFNPKQNFSCRQWCPVIICPHNGRSA